MVCQACGTPVVESVHYCSKCGAQVVMPQPARPSRSNRCMRAIRNLLYRCMCLECRRNLQVLGILWCVLGRLPDCERIDSALTFLRALATHNFGNDGWVFGRHWGGTFTPPWVGNLWPLFMTMAICAWPLWLYLPGMACCSAGPGAGRSLSSRRFWPCSRFRSEQPSPSIRCGFWRLRPQGWSTTRSPIEADGSSWNWIN